MAHAIPHAPAHSSTGTRPMLTAAEIAWGLTAVFAWLGWPYLRSFIVWLLQTIYELYVLNFY